MALTVTRQALTTLYTAPRLILCERSVQALFLEAVSTGATVMPYNGRMIGEGARGKSVSFESIGLPAGLEMIVAPAGCKTAVELSALVRSSGFSRAVPVLDVGAGKGAKAALAAAFLRAVDTNLGLVSAQRAERERQIVELRRSVEIASVHTNHLRGFLEMLGYASQELAIEQPVDLPGTSIALPASQKLPVLLSEVAGISIYAARADGASKARLALEVSGKTVAEQSIELSGPGWHDVFFPAGFLDNTQEALLTVEAVEGEPRLAAAAGGRPTPAIALRIWRNADPRVQPLRSTWERVLSRPKTFQGSVLNEAEVLRASGLPAIDHLITPLDDGLVQTHPVPRQISNYVVRDIDLGSISSISGDIVLDHPEASPVRFALFLAPQAPDASLYSALQAAFDKGKHDQKSRIAAATLGPGEARTLTVSTDGLDLSQPYCLVLAAKPATQATHYAWAKWKQVRLRAETKPFRQTYRYATFASLATQVQHADGPVVEEELTRQLRLRELGWSSVDLFLQTHPAQNRTVAARLHSFAPKGLQRLWLDVSIDHPDASPTEFGVLLTKSVIEPPFDRYYKENGLAGIADDVIYRIPDGAIVKKKVLRPLERGWLDLDMLEPLAQAMHLYLFVNVRSGSPAFGWCRWHRLAMTIQAESQS
ncbi:MAG: DUF6212 domain-containing protein [Rhizobiaceae bacterium]